MRLIPSGEADDAAEQADIGNQRAEQPKAEGCAYGAQSATPQNCTSSSFVHSETTFATSQLSRRQT